MNALSLVLIILGALIFVGTVALVYWPAGAALGGLLVAATGVLLLDRRPR